MGYGTEAAIYACMYVRFNRSKELINFVESRVDVDSMSEIFFLFFIFFDGFFFFFSMEEIGDGIKAIIGCVIFFFRSGKEIYFILGF